MKITYARSGMVGPALQSRMRDAHKYRAPLGWAGLGIWWRQVIESCYHQGSDSGVGVCRISGPPASGVVEGKSQDAGVLSVRVASLAMNLGSGCPAHPWRLSEAKQSPPSRSCSFFRKRGRQLGVPGVWRRIGWPLSSGVWPKGFDCLSFRESSVPPPYLEFV